MVKKFTIDCNFSGQKLPVTFYIGEAAIGSHPLGFQSKWLAAEKGGEVPKDLMESFQKLKDISDRNKISFEELCQYVLDEIKISQENKKIAIENNKKFSEINEK